MYKHKQTCFETCLESVPKHWVYTELAHRNTTVPITFQYSNLTRATYLDSLSHSVQSDWHDVLVGELAVGGGFFAQLGDESGVVCKVGLEEL